MIHHDQAFADAVESAVTAIETRTDAEVIVVAADKSGSYRDIGLAVGSGAAFALLAVLIEVPVHVHPLAVMTNMVFAYALFAWLGTGPRAVRTFTRRARRDRQVREAAEAEFHREAVHGTLRRTGLLIYLSAVEGRVEILPDLGLQERVPAGEWARALAAFRHDDLDHFLTGLSAVGEVLAAHVPAVDNDDVDLPNAPRIRR